jgi:hypothetical protein
MKPTIRASRGPLVIMLALLAALAIAACGGSSNSSGSSGSSSKNASKTTTTGASTTSASTSRTALAACLKSQGVTIGKGGAGGFGGFRHGTTTTGTPPAGAGGGTPPAGAGGGGGFPGGGGGGFAGGNSKFAKAFTACRKKLGIKGTAGFGGAGGFRAGGAGGSGAGGTPRFSTATLNSYVACIRKNGYAAMPAPKASSNGSFFPKSVETNAKFKAANKKCESVLLKAFRSRRRPGAGAAGGTSTISGSSTVSSA